VAANSFSRKLYHKQQQQPVLGVEQLKLPELQIVSCSDCDTALTNPMLAVKVGARQWSPVPKTILFFIASFLVVGRSIIRAEGLSGTML